MIEPLQEFDFGKSNYERQNQKWVCGWASEGEPCHIGPDSAGRCQAFQECRPLKQGDRYRCARPRNFGGDCESGPLPDGTCPQRSIECQPARSLLARRKLVSLSVTVLALGACLALFGGSRRESNSSQGEPTLRESFSSPGELALPHRIRDCADCHSAAKKPGNFEHWLHSALYPQMSSSDSQLCLDCHHELGPHPRAMRAHGMDSSELEAISGQMRQAAGSTTQPFVFSLVESIPGHSQSGDGELACALCHHEHRGRHADLTRMSNVQCQTCHTAKFHSFGDGHPPFDGYPYQRRTRLHFDHATHYRVHFATFRRVKSDAVPSHELQPVAAGTAPTKQSCYVCHRPDASGKTLPVRGFEQSCGACHGSEIEDDALPGLPLFAVPRLSVEELKTRKIRIGEWPTFEKGSAYFSLPAFTQLLLTADPDLAAAYEKIHTIDWKQLSEQDREMVERCLWDIKRLIHELVDEGRPALKRRLTQVLSSHAKPSELTALGGRLFVEPTFIDALSRAQKRWFPNLAEEIAALEQGQKKDPQAVDVSSAGLPAISTVTSGSYESDGDGMIRYRVTGHADKLVRTWLDVISRVPHLRDTTRRTASNDAGRRAALSEFFGVLADPAASYRCMGCHTADEKPDGRLQVNWLGIRSSPLEQGFTKFSHAPHVKLLAKQGCATCHRLQSEVNFVRPEFVRFRENWTINTDPHAARTSGFLPRGVSQQSHHPLVPLKQACAECHTSRQAGDSCLKCHNYHVFP